MNDGRVKSVLKSLRCNILQWHNSLREAISVSFLLVLYRCQWTWDKLKNARSSGVIKILSQNCSMCGLAHHEFLHRSVVIAHPAGIWEVMGSNPAWDSDFLLSHGGDMLSFVFTNLPLLQQIGIIQRKCVLFLVRIPYNPSTGQKLRKAVSSAWISSIMSFPNSFSKALLRKTS